MAIQTSVCMLSNALLLHEYALAVLVMDKP